MRQFVQCAALQTVLKSVSAFELQTVNNNYVRFNGNYSGSTCWGSYSVSGRLVCCAGIGSQNAGEFEGFLSGEDACDKKRKAERGAISVRRDD